MIQNRVYFFAHCWKQSTLNTIKSDEQKKLHVVHWFLCVLSTHYVWICLRERDLRILTVIFISAHRPELQPPAVRFFCAICWAQGCHRDRCHISQDTYFCCICQVAAFSVHYPIKNSLQHLKWPGEKNIARNLSISHKYTLKKKRSFNPEHFANKFNGSKHCRNAVMLCRINIPCFWCEHFCL